MNMALKAGKAAGKALLSREEKEALAARELEERWIGLALKAGKAAVAAGKAIMKGRDLELNEYVVFVFNVHSVGKNKRLLSSLPQACIR